MSDTAPLLMFLAHMRTTARAQQADFGVRVTKDVETALKWNAEGALMAVFTTRYVTDVLERIQAGDALDAIYATLVDRLMFVASEANATPAELRALGQLGRALRQWM